MMTFEKTIGLSPRKGASRRQTRGGGASELTAAGGLDGLPRGRIIADGADAAGAPDRCPLSATRRAARHGGERDLDGAVVVAQPDVPVLDRARELHRALREPREILAARHRDALHREVLRPLEGGPAAAPPEVGAAAVRVDDDLVGASAGASHQLFVGLADVDPEPDPAGQVALPQVRLVVGGKAVAEGQAFAGVERERQHAQHHPLVGLGRVPRDRQRVIGIVVALHVGDLELRLEDGRFQGHRVMSPDRRAAR